MLSAVPKLQQRGAGDPVKVLFIGGYGRSGSTLLDRVLGGVDGLRSAGEVRHIFREGYIENRLCGCGAPFRQCEFWAAVTERAFGGIDDFDAESMLGLQRRVDRWWRIPRLVGAEERGRRAADLRAYRDALRDLYLAIAAVSGASVIVDSSKDVSHGFVLRGVGGPIEPYFVHLVRDSRAVAYSWQRHKYNPGNGGEMNRYGLIRTSAEWTAINALTAIHARIGPRYRLLRYHDFVAEPAAAVDGILNLLGESGRQGPIGARRTVRLGEDHTVAGNPIRFRRGEVELRLDDEWRTRMKPASRALVTTLTLPVLAKVLRQP